MNDDVREALAAYLCDLKGGHMRTPFEREHWLHEADECLALVRPRGPVTDAEVEAAYAAALRNGAGQLTREDIRAALEAARTEEVQ